MNRAYFVCTTGKRVRNWVETQPLASILDLSRRVSFLQGLFGCNVWGLEVTVNRLARTGRPVERRFECIDGSRPGYPS